MANTAGPLRFLNSKAARVLTAVLVLQGILLYAISRPEYVPTAPPLASFPTILNDWKMSQEGYVDDETKEVLKADDLMTRTYASSASNLPVNLFIASFRSQRNGKAPHSPKNCLPGSGWTQAAAGLLTIDVPGHGQIEVNRYIVSKGDSRSIVLYWYQSRDRIVASEYRAKLYVVADSMRYNRTDSALVRVVVPVANNNDLAAEKTATEFVQATFPQLRNFLPN